MNQKRKIKIGITGSIGSGKSSVSNILIELGFIVLNADSISKELLQTNQKLKEKIIKQFGANAYEGGTLNKKYLAEKVFSNEGEVRKINAIVHPEVKKRITSLADDYLQNMDMVFAEAALIYEADMENIFDYIILVTASEEKRMQRKIKFENYSEDEFAKRNQNQIPDDEKKKRADFIIENNGSPEELKLRTKFTVKILEGLLSTNA